MDRDIYNAYTKGYQDGLEKIALNTGDFLNLAFTVPGLISSARHYLDNPRNNPEKVSQGMYPYRSIQGLNYNG